MYRSPVCHEAIAGEKRMRRKGGGVAHVSLQLRQQSAAGEARSNAMLIFHPLDHAQTHVHTRMHTHTHIRTRARTLSLLFSSLLFSSLLFSSLWLDRIKIAHLCVVVKVHHALSAHTMDCAWWCGPCALNLHFCA